MLRVRPFVRFLQACHLMHPQGSACSQGQWEDSAFAMDSSLSAHMGECEHLCTLVNTVNVGMDGYVCSVHVVLSARANPELSSV